MSELVTIYHGTCGALRRRIEGEEELRPKKGNKFVYVTTDESVAKMYSRAWTAWALENADQIEHAFGFRPEPKGLIVKTQIQKEFLEDDPYNPEGEPDQYRIEGDLSLDEAEFLEVDFTEPFSDPGNVMKAYAFWIGIGRATDND